jgi:hypothetical protein
MGPENSKPHQPFPDQDPIAERISGRLFLLLVIHKGRCGKILSSFLSAFAEDHGLARG